MALDSKIVFKLTFFIIPAVDKYIMIYQAGMIIGDNTLLKILISEAMVIYWKSLEFRQYLNIISDPCLAI